MKEHFHCGNIFDHIVGVTVIIDNFDRAILFSNNSSPFVVNK